MNGRLHGDPKSAAGSQLLTLAADPTFHAAATVLPVQGTTTRPAILSTVGVMLLGAARLLFGDTDRVADAELRYQWPLVRSGLAKAGVRDVPSTAPASRLFLSYRDRHLLVEDTFDLYTAALREMWCAGARQWAGPTENAVHLAALRHKPPPRMAHSDVETVVTVVPLPGTAGLIVDVTLLGTQSAVDIAQRSLPHLAAFRTWTADRALALRPVTIGEGVTVTAAAPRHDPAAAVRTRLKQAVLATTPQRHVVDVLLAAALHNAGVTAQLRARHGGST